MNSFTFPAVALEQKQVRPTKKVSIARRPSPARARLIRPGRRAWKGGVGHRNGERSVGSRLKTGSKEMRVDSLNPFKLS